MLPDPVDNLAEIYFSGLDVNRDGNISSVELTDPYALRLKDLLAGADTNRDGAVTQAELKVEIRKRTDFNRDGVVTGNEYQRAVDSGVFGKVQ